MPFWKHWGKSGSFSKVQIGALYGEGRNQKQAGQLEVTAIDEIENDGDLNQGIIGARGEKKDVDTWVHEDENQQDW